jgi:hydroxypyruvate isomerase
MRKFSACVEWLFADEAADFPDRVRLAAKAGFDAFEFWLWTVKDVDTIRAAMDETGIRLASFVAEPMIALTDPANHSSFIEGLKRSADVARRLGAKTLIAQAGNDRAGVSRAEQRAALTECLAQAAEILRGGGVTLGLEPLNTRIDHVGYFLGSTAEGLDIVDEVGSANVKIVYDVYHSAVMDERTEDVLAGRVDRVAHVHVADHPGRHQPGSGAIDLGERLNWIFANGYEEYVGLEYRPIGGTSARMADVLARLAG